MTELLQSEDKKKYKKNDELEIFGFMDRSRQKLRWNKYLTDVLIKVRFHQSKDNSCLLFVGYS